MTGDVDGFKGRGSVGDGGVREKVACEVAIEVDGRHLEDGCPIGAQGVVKFLFERPRADLGQGEKWPAFGGLAEPEKQVSEDDGEGQ